jgi:hypothetical protein
MKKFDIRKTFDIFWREPLSVLAGGLFQLVNIQSNIFTRKALNVDLAGKKPQITVVNNEKMYNLFQTVMLKRRMLEGNEPAIK